jgi:hypothetical protein
MPMLDMGVGMTMRLISTLDSQSLRHVLASCAKTVASKLFRPSQNKSRLACYLARSRYCEVSGHDWRRDVEEGGEKQGPLADLARARAMKTTFETSDIFLHCL